MRFWIAQMIMQTKEKPAPAAYIMKQQDKQNIQGHMVSWRVHTLDEATHRKHNK